MNAPRFVHLRLHSEYSVTDGIVRIDAAVARAAAYSMPALALTDSANVFGMVKFYKAARAAGIKPIVGADCWIRNEADREKPARLLLLCASAAGYRKLSELLSRAWLKNQYRGRAEIAKSWFDEAGSDGLIALSGAGAGEVGQALASGNDAVAARLAADWAERFPGRFYLELQRAGFANSEPLVARTLGLAGKARLPVVATHPVQFLAAEDFRAHEARVCIAEGNALGDRRRPRLFTPEQYLKSPQEMARLFADVPQAIENASEIARRCNLEIDLGRNRLPEFPTPAGVTVDQHLAAEAGRGLEGRLERLFRDPAAREREAPRYRERLAFEIKTIVQMGFAGYFLIVADFINWARAHRDAQFPNGIPVGPGRGSGAGSLVAYSLGITDLDPLRYDLLFERFLNPERVSMPDFDIDFCQDKRDRVIRYVRDEYGHDRVAAIITFGKLQARAVLRDVGRVLGMPYGQVDRICKLVPNNPAKPVTLAQALESEQLLKEQYSADEEIKRLIDLALQLEGLYRNASTHAAGVVIGDRPLD
ncbi:MAG TPA: DNA polymerase III subunit alpha, partial [Burkholderiales bacterium]|nr:DNA polymerase III subunit alpha [Burkholderiales bacterium]